MDWTGLADGEVRVVLLARYDNGMRVRMPVSRRGVWPRHVEERAELYVVLRGEVIYDLPDREAPIGAGQAILLDPGEPDGARVLKGAVSINVDSE